MTRNDHHVIHQAHPASRAVQRPSNLPQVDLEIIRGQAKDKVRPVTVPAFLIGSAEDCDLVLAATHFPEVHAYLLLTREGVSIRHLGFVPELTVNGQQVSRATLTDGDRIQTGPFEFRVRIQMLEQTGSDDEPELGDRSSESSELDDAIRASVGQLLKDIRATISSDSSEEPPLRLFVDPESNSHRGSSTASREAQQLVDDLQASGT